jgi:hypothetical protein
MVPLLGADMKAKKTVDKLLVWFGWMISRFLVWMMD